MENKVTYLIPPAEPIQKYAPDRNFGCNLGIAFNQPAHILYSAAVLEKNGYKVDFVDAPVEGHDQKWMENYIKATDSNTIIFFTVYLAESIDKWWANKIRELRPDMNIVFTGPEPTRKPYDFIFDDKVFVARGEPEFVIHNLMNAINNGKKFEGISGVSWKTNNGTIVDNSPNTVIENLDELPFPAIHLLKAPDKYFNPKLIGRPTTTTFTNRQCPYRCSYCVPSAYMFAREIEGRRASSGIDKGRIVDFSKSHKPMTRYRSPENIFEEFKSLKEKGYKSVAIMDDNFLAGVKNPDLKKRILKICELIKPLGMEWGCLARADELQDEEILKAMKESGCRYVDIGIESFDQKVLDYVKKDLKVGDNFNAIVMLQRAGIEPKVNILLGASPLQDADSIKWTVEVLKKLDINYVSFGIVTPHPATDFYYMVEKEGWFGTKSKDWVGTDTYSEGIVDFPNMNHEELKKWVSWCYKEYYLRPSYIFKRLISTKSFRQLMEQATTAKNLMFRREM